MRHFQRTYGHRESIVDQLFEGASDRLWALTSKVDGTYEFEVLSLREYFAARFLYRNAGEENVDFDNTTVLQELLRRPYWLNTARFYGGNAKGSDVYTLTAGIEQELAQTSASASYLAAGHCSRRACAADALSGHRAPWEPPGATVVEQRDDLALEQLEQAVGLHLVAVIDVGDALGEELAQPLLPSNISSHQPSRMEQLRAPLRAAFSPLVPLASIGRRGVFSHTSLP